MTFIPQKSFKLLSTRVRSSPTSNGSSVIPSELFVQISPLQPCAINTSAHYIHVHFILDLPLTKKELVMMRGMKRNIDEWRLCTVSIVVGLAFMLASLSVIELYLASEPIGSIQEEMVFSKENYTSFPRKLLSLADEDGSMNRMGGGTCSKDNIVIFQGPTAPLPNGIPTYTVQIMNMCVSGCSVSNIHLSCGWFSSARLINPRLFRRICYDDCLVNNGEAIGPGESLSFQYANTYSYPLSVSSVAC